MSRRSNNPPSDNSELEWESDDFDTDYAADTGDVHPTASSSDSGGPILTADQVAAVRFYTTRPGYSFEQVEIFVDQVKESLATLESMIYQKDLALHEAKEDQGELQDRISTLAATIEVFRAKGDPVVRADGTYLTESQRASESDLQALQSVKDELAAQLENARREASVLQEALAETKSALSEQEARAQEAEDAEAELRDYVENTLANWMAQRAAQQQVHPDPPPAPTSVEAQDGLVPYSQEHDSPGPILQDTAHDQYDPEPGTAETPFASEWPAPADSDWGSDAPSVGDRPLTPEEQIAALPHLPPPTTPPRARAKLIDAPELSGQ
jgi:cell division septum initiation protein DivIVA